MSDYFINSLLNRSNSVGIFFYYSQCHICREILEKIKKTYDATNWFSITI